MKKQEKVKRYSRIYKDSLKKKKSVKSLILFYFVLFVVIAAASYFVTMGVRSFLNRPRCTKIGPIEEVDQIKNSNSASVNSENIAVKNSKIDNINLEIKGEEVDLKTFMNNKMFNSFLAKIRNNEKNAVVVCLKGEDGRLAYDSNLDSANNWNTVAKNGISSSYLENAVEKIRDEGLIPIARISAFFDQLAPSVDYDNSFVFDKGRAGNFNEKVHVFSAVSGFKMGKWLNAMKAEARTYIADVAVEIMSKGFEYVLIDNVCFPVFKSKVELENSDDFDDELKINALLKFLDELNRRGVRFILSYPARVIYDHVLSQNLFGGIKFLDKFRNHAPFFENEGEIKKCEKTFSKILGSSNSYFIAPRLPSFWNNSSRVKNLLQKSLINSNLVVK